MTITEAKDVLSKNLKDKVLENALDIVDYLDMKGLIPVLEWDNGIRFVKNERSPCLLVFNWDNKGEWFICDLPVGSEPDWNTINDDLKNLIIENIKICNVHQGNPCGCGSEPGVIKTIFGKEYTNVCTSEIQLVNPEPNILEKYKKIIDWWVLNISA